MIERIKNPTVKNTANIFLCFLLTSTGYFLWLYNLRNMLPADTADIMATVVGYALQGLGVLLFSISLRKGVIPPKTLFIGALALYFVCLIPASLSHSASGALTFGFIDSLLCGVIAGYYLYQLTLSNGEKTRATAFGLGYGLATVASWLFSLIKGFYDGHISLIVCLVLTALTVILAFSFEEERTEPLSKKASPALKNLIIASALLIFLFSLVNNIGFAFQSTELIKGISLEFSRMFYAVGLICAGIVSDKSRKNGAICALSALAVPFITLALIGEAVPLTIFWALGYFAFGFYSVYRIILFSEISKTNSLLFLSGYGLLLGRLGDSVGTGIKMLFTDFRSALVISAAILFALSIFLFFKLYQILYVPSAKEQRSEKEIFNDFAAKHDLSSREREVLRLLLSEKTNKEIAEALYVSESTVKFHIHNLLKKTGVKSRLELISLYNDMAKDVFLST